MGASIRDEAILIGGNYAIHVELKSIDNHLGKIFIDRVA